MCNEPYKLPFYFMAGQIKFCTMFLQDMTSKHAIYVSMHEEVKQKSKNFNWINALKAYVVLRIKICRLLKWNLGNC